MRLELAYEAKGAPNNFMDPNIYLNAVVFTGSPNVVKSKRSFLSRSSSRSTSLTSRVRPGRAIIRKTQAGPGLARPSEAH
jgi:hypothetical protein